MGRLLAWFAPLRPRGAHPCSLFPHQREDFRLPLSRSGRAQRAELSRSQRGAWLSRRQERHALQNCHTSAGRLTSISGSGASDVWILAEEGALLHLDGERLVKTYQPEPCFQAGMFQ
jgi:hypothetical protein